MASPTPPPKYADYSDIFDSERLAHTGGIDNALSELQAVLHENNFMTVLDQFFDKSLTMELILSGNLTAFYKLICYSHSVDRITRVYTVNNVDLRQIPHDV
jgi:hypothetical protein